MHVTSNRSKTTASRAVWQQISQAVAAKLASNFNRLVYSKDKRSIVANASFLHGQGWRVA